MTLTATDSIAPAPARPAREDEVPVLDLAPLRAGADVATLAARLREACTTTGFFYVTNHGIESAVTSAIFEATERYFALPLEQRLHHRMDERFRRGFMPEGINQHPGYAPDIKESYEIGMDLPLDHPAVVAGLPLHGPNRWPDECPWLRTAAEAYFDAAAGLGRNLLSLFACALALPRDYFAQFCTNPMVQMRLFHYRAPTAADPTGDEVHQRAFGVAPHTDYGMITLLLQDPSGGLEVRKRDGEWIAANHVDGALVINLGDLFQRWTNDVFVSNPHRVINRSGRDRYSVPVFFNLDWDTPVSCLPGCATPGEPPHHAPIGTGEYLLSRFRDVQKYRANPPAADA